MPPLCTLNRVQELPRQRMHGSRKNRRRFRGGPLGRWVQMPLLRRTCVAQLQSSDRRTPRHQHVTPRQAIQPPAKPCHPQNLAPSHTCQLRCALRTPPRAYVKVTSSSLTPTRRRPTAKPSATSGCLPQAATKDTNQGQPPSDLPTTFRPRKTRLRWSSPYQAAQVAIVRKRASPEHVTLGRAAATRRIPARTPALRMLNASVRSLLLVSPIALTTHHSRIPARTLLQGLTLEPLKIKSYRPRIWREAQNYNYALHLTWRWREVGIRQRRVKLRCASTEVSIWPPTLTLRNGLKGCDASANTPRKAAKGGHLKCRRAAPSVTRSVAECASFKRRVTASLRRNTTRWCR